MLAAVVVGVVLCALLVVALRGPAMVDRVVVENRSPAPVTVRVAAAGSSSVLPLGTVSGVSRTRFEQVLDQGDEWTFMLRVGADELTPIHRTRDRLEQDDWRVEIPANAAARLAPDRG